MDRALDYLYGREYAGAACGSRDEGSHRRRSEDSVLAVPDWLKDVRELFPRETVEIIERHALERYGMTELVTDAERCSKMEPSYELLKAVLSFRHLMAPKVLEVARQLVRQVVEELRGGWRRTSARRSGAGSTASKRSPLKVARNLDWHRTIRANLKHYDRERKRLIVESLHFFSRVEHHIPWHIIMAVDCSGSMMDSVIHSAVMAGIFKGLPAVRVSLVAFDTAVVDLTEQADDPTEVLMSVQLGGGTDIAGALGYCETLVQSPTRTIVVLVTDFFEGGPPDRLLAGDQAAARGRGARARPGRARRRGEPDVRPPDGRAVRRRRRRGGRTDAAEAGRMDGPGALLTAPPRPPWPPSTTRRWPPWPTRAWCGGRARTWRRSAPTILGRRRRSAALEVGDATVTIDPTPSRSRLLVPGERDLPAHPRCLDLRAGWPGTKSEARRRGASPTVAALRAAERGAGRR